MLKTKPGATLDTAPVMNRRMFLGATSAFGVAAIALPGAAWAQTRTVPAQQILPYRAEYLSLRAEERDSFRLEYVLRSKDAGPLPPLNWIRGGVRTPVQLSPQGAVLNPPSDGTALRETQLEIVQSPGEARRQVSLGMSPKPNLTLAPVMPVARPAEAVREIGAAIGRFAGVMGMFAPRMTGVAFVGVPSGQAVFADGRRRALPLDRGRPVYKPDEGPMRNARELVFPSAPTDAAFV